MATVLDFVSRAGVAGRGHGSSWKETMRGTWQASRQRGAGGHGAEGWSNRKDLPPSRPGMPSMPRASGGRWAWRGRPAV